MNLVGINGFKRAGKGEAGRTLARLHHGATAQLGFADNVKLWAARALGYLGLTKEEAAALMDEFKDRGLLISGPSQPRFIKGEDEQWLPENIPHKSISGREYLQHIGNQARVMFGDTFWIDQVLPQPVEHCPGMDALDHKVQNARHLTTRYPNVDCLVITDLRYPNEAERVRDLGGVVWRVNRPGASSDGHVSEIPLDDSLVDHEITNDGDFDNLERQVATAMLATLSLPKAG